MKDIQDVPWNMLEPKTHCWLVLEKYGKMLETTGEFSGSIWVHVSLRAGGAHMSTLVFREVSPTLIHTGHKPYFAQIE